MLHEPAKPAEKDPAGPYKMRLGIWMFALYSLFYAGFELDGRSNELGARAFRVRNADRGSHVDIGMLHKDVVNYPGKDLETGDTDHVFEPINNEEVTVFIHLSDIACVEPAVPKTVGIFFGFVMVSLEDLWALHDYFAGLAHGDRFSG